MLLSAMVLAGCQSQLPEKQEETSYQENSLPSQLASIPTSYFSATDHQGSLEDLYYDTFESFSYEEHSQVIQKHAVVYLPEGYDDSKQYPVFYMMHGGWSDEYTYLGNPKNPHQMKYVLDHGIANHEIAPMIVVCPTYNNTSSKDSGDYGLALDLTNQYHHELINDLILAVEGKYHTYLEEKTLDGIAASRDYWTFGGFSMGSMATWRAFEHCLDYFRYFMPSSGGPDLRAQDYVNVVRDSGHDWDDFFIFAASGTNDFAYSGFKRGIDALASVDQEVFRYADNEEEGNLYYLESDGDHSGAYAMQYLYNGLRWLWKS